MNIELQKLQRYREALCKYREALRLHDPWATPENEPKPADFNLKRKDVAFIAAKIREEILGR